MKRLWKVLLVLVLLLAGAGVAGHLVLKYRLTDLLNARLAPAVTQRTQADFHIGGASVDLFRGSVDLHEVALSNQPGFEAPYLFELATARLDTRLGPLVKAREIDIEALEVKQATLTIERNADGGVNLGVLQQRLKPGEAASGAGPSPEPSTPDAQEDRSPPPSPAERRPPPRILVKQSDLNLAVHYIDHRIRPGQPVELTLEETLTVRGLRLGAEGEPAAVTIEGGLQGQQHLFSTKLAGYVEPIRDLQKLSFDMEGSVANVEPSLVEAYLAKSDLSCRSLDVELELVCTDGVFEPGSSEIALVMYDLVLPDDLARKAAGIEKLDRISIPIGIQGPLAGPRTDNLATVLAGAVMANLADNPQLQKALSHGLRKVLGLDEDAPEEGGDAAQPSAEDAALNEAVDQAAEKAGELLQGLFR